MRCLLTAMLAQVRHPDLGNLYANRSVPVRMQSRS